MSLLLGFAGISFLAVLQTSLVNHLRLLDGRPDLILLAVTGWALSGHGRQAMLFGFVGGFALDLFSEVPLGVSSAALVLVAALVSYSEGRFWGIHPLMQLAAVLAASGVFYAAQLASLGIGGHPFDLLLVLNRTVLPSLFLNLVLALPAAQAAEALSRFFTPGEVTA
ncbi:MAG: rod shape-determining protein MreD [Anaerolineales bacterium]